MMVCQSGRFGGADPTFPLVEGESFDGYNAISGAAVGSLARVWGLAGAAGLSFVTGLNGVGQALQFAGNNTTINAFRTFSPTRVLGQLTRTVGAVGFRWRQSALGTFQHFPVSFASGATYTLGFGVNTSGAIFVSRMTAINAGTTLGTSSTGVIAANTSYWISIQYEISDGAGRVRVCVGGVEVLNLTSVDTNNGVGSVDRLVLANRSVDTAITVDDIIQFDTYTEVPRVNGYQLRPSADTGTKQLTPSTGSTNFNLVNSATVSETTYVSGATAGLQDIYDFGNLPVSPTGVLCVVLGAYGGKTNANAQTAYLPVNGSDGAAFTLQDPDTFFFRPMAGPPSGGDWTETSVNAMQAGFKVGTGTSTCDFMELQAEVFVRP